MTAIRGTGPTFPVPMHQATQVGLTADDVTKTYAYVSTTWEELSYQGQPCPPPKPTLHSYRYTKSNITADSSHLRNCICNLNAKLLITRADHELEGLRPQILACFDRLQYKKNFAISFDYDLAYLRKKTTFACLGIHQENQTC